MLARSLIPQTATVSVLFPRTIALMHCQSYRTLFPSSGLTRETCRFKTIIFQKPFIDCFAFEIKRHNGYETFKMYALKQKIFKSLTNLDRLNVVIIYCSTSYYGIQRQCLTCIITGVSR